MRSVPCRLALGSAALPLLILVGCGGGGAGSSSSTSQTSTGGSTTYTISGTVSGDVASGVTLSLSGADSASTTTGSTGTYTFSGLASGSYTLTPSLSGYTFSPSSTPVTLSTDTSGIDFTSTTTSSSSLGDRTDYDSVTLSSQGTYSSSSSGVTGTDYSYTCSTADTPAVKVAPGGSLSLTHCKITKTGSTSATENSGFYGFNAGVLTSSSSSTSAYTSSSAASLSMSDCTITTAATGANGAFAFGQNATVTLDHVTIKTTGDSNSRGVDATYGGTLTISNSTISTTGGSCAALASDRYTGTSAPSVTATNCTGTTAGTGSPCIYCTGTFVVTDCTLAATGSEAACIEGLNSITLDNSSISGTQKWGVIIYQSTSGDSSEGTGTFSMTDGTLTNSSSGPAFFVCNTDAVINLSGATLSNSSDMLLVAGTASAAQTLLGSNVNSSWGSSGGTVTLTATGQALSGSIILCESSSSLALTLNASTLTGAIDTNDIGGTRTVTLDDSSLWTADADSHVTTLKGIQVGSSGVPTNVDAASGCTITCDSLQDASGAALSGSSYTLSSGGTLVKSGS
nr:carboxypeptidase regulatory-like domain-containing protein [uncultured Holophaga sp.]